MAFTGSGWADQDRITGLGLVGPEATRLPRVSTKILATDLTVAPSRTISNPLPDLQALNGCMIFPLQHPTLVSVNGMDALTLTASRCQNGDALTTLMNGSVHDEN